MRRVFALFAMLMRLVHFEMARCDADIAVTPAYLTPAMTWRLADTRYDNSSNARRQSADGLVPRGQRCWEISSANSPLTSKTLIAPSLSLLDAFKTMLDLYFIIRELLFYSHVACRASYTIRLLRHTTGA